MNSKKNKTHNKIKILFILVIFLTQTITITTHSEKIEDNDLICVDKITKEIQIPPNSDYIIKYSKINRNLAELTNQPLTNDLSQKIKEAISKSPKWIQRNLTRQFKIINDEEYADLIIQSEKKYVDEIAFCIASSSIGDVPEPELILDNVLTLYENDEYIQYANIIDYDDNNGNYFSTVRYNTLENDEVKTFEYPPDIYYWYIVHPENSGEKPIFKYDSFWRNYLFNHNDIGYPLLKEKISKIQYLWDSESYSQHAYRTWKWSMENHPTAIEAVSYWIGKTVPNPAKGDRPSQPVIISHEHNGYCGELQKLAVAALRTCLVPSLGACNIGEDHVWREFYEQGWHENDNWWSDTGGAVDLFDIYEYGWGKDMSSVFAWIGDDSIFDLTSNYIHSEDRYNIEFNVLDRKLQPVDGARVTVFVIGPKDITVYKRKILTKMEEIWEILPDIIKGKFLQMIYDKIVTKVDEIPEVVDGPTSSIWNYTDINGKCCFELGKNCEYLFIIQYGDLKKPYQLAKCNTLRVLEQPEEKVYKIWFPKVKNDDLKFKNIDENEGNLKFELLYDSYSYQIQESALWIKDQGVYNRKGKTEFFIVDEENYEKYQKNKRFLCLKYFNSEEKNINFNLNEENYYLIFRNPAKVSNLVLNFSIGAFSEFSDDFINIISPDTDIFLNPTYNIGDIILFEGVSSDDLELFIDDEQHEINVENGYWSYIWDTTNYESGKYSISVICNDKKDSIIVDLKDTIIPELTIKLPTINQIINSNILHISGTAFDNQKLDRIEVSIENSRYKKAEGLELWSLDWDLSSYGMGVYNLSVRAYDIEGLSFEKKHLFVLNESGQNFGPIIEDSSSVPLSPINTSNVIVYANITSDSVFPVKRVIINWDYGTGIKSHQMYEYGNYPIQDRHEEDSLNYQSNAPRYGFELGQFPSQTTIVYWIEAYDYADNYCRSHVKTIFIA